MTKDKLKTLNQVYKIKDKINPMLMVMHQVMSKIKFKMKSNLRLLRKLKIMVKTRTKIVVMTKWLLKNLLKKPELVARA